MVKIFLIGAVASVLACGCKTNPDIQVIETDGPTNQTQRVSGGFSDMTFIWENWIYGTNRVDTAK